MSKIIVVTGSREWRDIERIQTALIGFQQIYPEDEIILRQGCASGADAIARSIADFLAWNIEDFWPDYTSYEFAEANKVRNIMMLVKYPSPHQLYAFPTMSSRGTWHTVSEAKKRNIPVRIYEE